MHPCPPRTLPPHSAARILPPTLHPLPAAAGKLGIIKDAGLRARWERASSRAELDELARQFVEGVRSDT